MASTLARIRNAVARREQCFLSTPNLTFLVACQSDEAFRNSVIDSDLSIADGAPLLWIARLLRIPIPERVPGAGVFERLRDGSQSPIRVYFFGGDQGVAEAACRQTNSCGTGLVCVGHEFPGFGSIDSMSSDETIARINDSGADFVIVSLGARKGQAWIVRNKDKLHAPVISHLGAVIKFSAGTVRRAPSWMQRFGLEWVWRIKEEPELWRRYFSDGLVFLQLLVTRVVPYFLLSYCRVPRAPKFAPAALEYLVHEDTVAIRLKGAWTLDNLKGLRDCFADERLAEKNIRLEMAHVTDVDAAFLGLLMLMYGDRRRRGRRLVVSGSNGFVRRLFRYACADYLLETE